MKNEKKIIALMEEVLQLIEDQDGYCVFMLGHADDKVNNIPLAHAGLYLPKNKDNVPKVPSKFNLAALAISELPENICFNLVEQLLKMEMLRLSGSFGEQAKEGDTIIEEKVLH
jgi:hypothetical protein